MVRHPLQRRFNSDRPGSQSEPVELDVAGKSEKGDPARRHAPAAPSAYPHISRFARKRVLLTGASSGIGAVAAEKLAAEGATVIAVSRREHLLDEVVERIAARGGNAVAVPTNLADMEAVDALVHAVGQLDILINNAGPVHT